MPPTTTTTRSATLPALLYVLAAFGVISGGYGALTAIQTAVTFTQPRDTYQKLVDDNKQALKPMLGAAEAEYLARQAEARYARRNAALPLAGVGLILSCLMFAGAVRAMRADAWGLSAWSFAAAASIPYQLLDLALTLVMNRDVARSVKTLPAMQPIAQLASILMCGFVILYYGVCVIYLRTPGVRRAFSDGGTRTTPSA